MATRTDFQNRPDGDFPLEDTIDSSGKYLPTPIVDSNSQHVLDLLYYSKSSVKKYPLAGFAILRKLNSEISIFTIEDELKESMNYDGYDTDNGCVYPNEKSSFGVDLNYIYVKK